MGLYVQIIHFFLFVGIDILNLNQSQLLNVAYLEDNWRTENLNTLTI